MWHGMGPNTNKDFGRIKSQGDFLWKFWLVFKNKSISTHNWLPNQDVQKRFCSALYEFSKHCLNDGGEERALGHPCVPSDSWIQT